MNPNGTSTEPLNPEWDPAKPFISPEPLPVHRQHRLSALHFKPQDPQCYLLNRLPPELRRNIYIHLFGRNTIHIANLGKRLAHVRCNSDGRDPDRMCYPAAQFYNAQRYIVPISNGNIALLKTCRQIYVEAIDILYSSSTFDFDRIRTLFDFIHSLRSQRLAAVQTMNINLGSYNLCFSNSCWLEYLECWPVIISTIATHMTALKTLNIAIMGYDLNIKEFHNDRNCSDWILSLLQAQHKKRFNLEVTIEKDESSEKPSWLEAAKFHSISPNKILSSTAVGTTSATDPDNYLAEQVWTFSPESDLQDLLEDEFVA
ncbi:MAG: hypothetical protein Q9190_004017 [Brigantiaea leucoxantha]